MKKTLIIVAVLVALVFVSCSETPAWEDIINEGFSLSNDEILSMSKQERLEFLCPYYDIPVEKTDYNLPDKNYVEILYDWVVGDYANGYNVTLDEFKLISHNHADVASFFINAQATEAGGSLFIGRENPPYSDNELFLMQVKAVLLAQKIHDLLHTSGLITDSMTEYQKCKVYFDWMYENIGHHQLDTYNTQGNLVMITDHAYNCLSKSYSNCGARGGAFALVMHTEGIKCQSIGVQGHIMNRVMLDGTEYWLDWANSFRDIKTPEQWRNNQIVNNNKLPPEQYDLIPAYKCLLF